MGLWDTVLSQNSSGHVYNLGMPAQFTYVAQAVGLNEYRGHIFPDERPDPHNWDTFGAFPLESIIGDAVPAGQTRIERGFIGSHADIGGGFKNNELSKVALAWMVEQARTAGVEMRNVSIDIVGSPVLHDKSSNIQSGRPVAASTIEDRAVRYLDNTTTRQRAMDKAGMSYADTEQFINYADRSTLLHDVRPGYQNDIMSNETGAINMDGYRTWLLLNGYDLGNLRIN